MFFLSSLMQLAEEEAPQEIDGAVEALINMLPYLVVAMGIIGAVTMLLYSGLSGGAGIKYSKEEKEEVKVHEVKSKVVEKKGNYSDMGSRNTYE